MIVIVLLGILAAIAIPSWFGMIEGRRVESAANQLAADLRFAHSRAANQIGTASSVTLYPDQVDESDGPDYMIRNGAAEQNRTLPGDVRIINPASQKTLGFTGNGSVAYSFTGPIRLQSRDSIPLKITVNKVTSDVQVIE